MQTLTIISWFQQYAQYANIGFNIWQIHLKSKYSTQLMANNSLKMKSQQQIELNHAIK